MQPSESGTRWTYAVLEFTTAHLVEALERLRRARAMSQAASACWLKTISVRGWNFVHAHLRRADVCRLNPIVVPS